jgi:UDP-N-acetylmuramyl pentapeptide phosphotransferase/UDP-N-acetylglucosamine-1-phosphate transferase
VTRTPRHAGSSAVASLAAVIGSAAASWSLLRTGRVLPTAVRDPWARTNHAGSTVTLLEGPAWVGGALAGAAGATAVEAVVSRLAPGAAGRSAGRSGGSAGATAIVALSAGALGALDDLVGGAADKGLRGHLRALARGEVTTGAVKIVGLGLTGLLGVVLVDSRGPGRGTAERPVGSGRPGWTDVLSTLVGGAVVAGAANAVNLFDLRPGRALKVTVAAGLPMVSGAAGGLAAAATVGSGLGVARDDLAASSMLGDTGANAAGALLGLALLERTGPVGRTVALAVLAALTLASERVSFTRVIEADPVLRRIDEWGREPR